MSKKSDAEKLISIIESISSEAQDLPRKSNRKEQEAIGYIYILCHAFRAESCNKNHPSWKEKLTKALKDTPNQ